MGSSEGAIVATGGACRAERWDAWLDARLLTSGADVPVLVANLSSSGCLATLDHHFAIGDRATVVLPGLAPRDLIVVRRVLEFAGCRFALPLTRGELARLHPVEEAGLSNTALPGDHAFRPAAVIGLRSPRRDDPWMAG